MHQARIFLRKVILSKETTTEIANERCILIKKQELFNASIQEAEIFISRMRSEGNQCTNKTCSVELDMDNSRQQNIENNSSPDEYISMLNNVNAYGQNGEAGDSNRRSRNIDASVQYDENLSFLESGKANSSNISKTNNKVSDRCEFGGLNGEKDVTDIVPMDRTSNTFGNFVLSGSKSDNSQIYIVKSNQANKNTDCSSSTENFKNSSYKTKKIPPNLHDDRRKMKHHGIEDNITETSSKRKLHRLKSGDTRNVIFAVAPPKERNLTKSGPKVKIISETDKTPRSFEDVITKNTDEDCKRIEAEMKILHNDNITSPRREDMKNSINKCGSCLKIFDNENKGEKARNETPSRSVTDLITYFENLCPKKQPNVKSKIKSFESKQGLKKHGILKVDRIFKSNATPSTQKDLNIGSKNNDGKRSVVKQRDVILLDSDTDNKETPPEVVPENFFPAINMDDRKQNIEASPKDSLPDLNTRVKERSLKIISEKSIPDLSTRNCQNMLFRSTKVSYCNFCKGNCEHFQQDINRSDEKTNIIKEHKFVFSDDGFNEMEQPKVSYPRRFRSRFTRKHTSPIYPRPLVCLDDSQNDEESGLNFISSNRKESGNSLPRTRNQRAIRNCSTHGSLNLSPLIQNSIEVRKHEGKYISQRKKPKSSERGCNVKRFIGIFFALVISVLIYKGVYESYKLW